MRLTRSTRANKRYMMEYRDGSVTHFGLRGGRTYVDGASEATKRAYLARHRPRENWNDPKSAGALSRWILWGPSRLLGENVRRFKQSWSLL